MLSNLKAALTLLCLSVLMVDALRTSGMENLARERKRIFYRKRNVPPVKRDLPAQQVTVCPTLLDDSSTKWSLIPPPSSPSITGGITQVPSRIGTGIMQRIISKAALFSVCDLRTSLYPTSHLRFVQYLISGRATPNHSAPNL